MVVFDLTGDMDCVAAVERLPALYQIVVFSCSLVSMIPLWNFKTIRGLLMKPKWLKQASACMVKKFDHSTL